jgi:hypothetical protein
MSQEREQLKQAMRSAVACFPRGKFIELELGEYAGIRNEYRTEVWAAIREYLSVDAPVTVYQNRMRTAIANAFYGASEMAWVDGGGEDGLSKEAQSWLTSRLDAELGYTGELFQRLRMLKKDDDFAHADADAEANARADAYARTLDQVYNTIKAFAAKNQMLTFGGQSGADSCTTCRKLMGQRHRAKWWVSRNYVPGPANAFECGGWRCRHFLFDDKGKVFSI